MTGVAPASAALRVRRHSGGAEIALDPAWELGSGGEATVYALPGGRWVAKVYREPTLERAQKLTWMVENPPALPPGGEVALAWPTELLTDARGWLAGFVMPRVEGPRVFELYNPVTRRKAAPLFHWGLLHRAGAHLAAAFEAVHAGGYVVGDVNESNILVSPAGAVTLVDTDSFQVRGQRALFRSRVGRAEFTPPELQGVNFGEVDRTPEHDRFGLAVLLFLLLMEGTHPFAARFRAGEETPPTEERIRRGLFPYAAGEAPIRPPRLAPAFDALHPELRALFVTAFVDGHADPSARPTAAEWRAALETAEAALVACRRNPQHRFGAHVEACPWCARATLLRGRDPFPPTVEAARRAEAPPVAATPREAVDESPAARPAPAAPPAPATTTPAAPALPGWYLKLTAPLAGNGLLGPVGIQHPAAWLAPAMTLLLLGPPWMKLGGVALAFFALVRLGPGSSRPAERVTGWAAILLTLVLLLGLLVRALPAPDPTPRERDEVPPPFETPLPPPPDDALPEPPPPVETPLPPRPIDTRAEWGPEPRNPGEVARAVEEHYPAALRESGLGGTVVVHFQVGLDGVPDPSTVSVGSATSDAFVEPALRVVERMRFDPPPVKDGVRPRDWVKMPIHFGTAP